MDIQLKRLPHQIECLRAITSVFEDVRITSNNPIYQNPIIDLKDDRIIENIDRIWDGKDLDLKPIPKSMRRRIDGEILGIDAKLETGERVIIVTGCINVLESRVSGTSINNNSCIY